MKLGTEVQDTTPQTIVYFGWCTYVVYQVIYKTMYLCCLSTEGQSRAYIVKQHKSS